MLGGDHARTLAEISDGTANTFMAGEVVADFKAWGDPTNWRDPHLGLNQSPRGFGSPLAGRRELPVRRRLGSLYQEQRRPALLKALATPAGDEKVSAEQY